MFPHEVVDGEVAAVANAVEFARAILTAESREVFAGHGTSAAERRGRSDRVSMRGAIMLRQSNRLKQPGTPPLVALDHILFWPCSNLKGP